MSYCRWSSDDFQCDIYCYEDGSGYRVHVASMKYVFKKPFPPLPTDDGSDSWAEKWVKRSKQVGLIIRESKLVPIGLPMDGKSFRCATAKETAGKLIELREAGYRVLQYAIDTLLEEAKGDSQ